MKPFRSMEGTDTFGIIQLREVIGIAALTEFGRDE